MSLHQYVLESRSKYRSLGPTPRVPALTGLRWGPKTFISQKSPGMLLFPGAHFQKCQPAHHVSCWASHQSGLLTPSQLLLRNQVYLLSTQPAEQTPKATSECTCPAGGTVALTWLNLPELDPNMADSKFLKNNLGKHFTVLTSEVLSIGVVKGYCNILFRLLATWRTYKVL